MVAGTARTQISCSPRSSCKLMRDCRLPRDPGEQRARWFALIEGEARVDSLYRTKYLLIHFYCFVYLMYLLEI